MASSPARVAANRLNALKSTGPTTPEGKATSRRNAFKHGMAGQGDLPGPDDDLALVERRAAAFAARFGAEDEVAAVFANRAALLSVRMERAAEREFLAVAASAEAARLEFDAQAALHCDQLIEGMDATNWRETLTALEACPDGLFFLINEWARLGNQLGSPDPTVVATATSRVSQWLRLSNAPARTDLAERVEIEKRRLEQVKQQVDARTEQARTHAGLLASFDPSPAANLARRYEAAAERGMYRAIQALTELEPLDVPTDLDHFGPPVDPPGSTLPHSNPTTLPNLEPIALAAAKSAAHLPVEPAALASFRAGNHPWVEAANPLPVIAPATDPDRPRRPDLRKLDRKHRSNHR